MHLVREMKKYGDIRVANAMFALGWSWRKPRQRPTKIERMVEGMPRVDLVRILQYLQRKS